MREVSLPSTRFSSFERLRQPPSGCFISVGVKTNGGEGVKEKGIHKRGGEMEKTGKEELLTLQKRSGKGRDSLLSSFFSCRSPSFLNTHFCVSFRKKWVPLTLLRGRCLRTSKCSNKRGAFLREKSSLFLSVCCGGSHPSPERSLAVSLLCHRRVIA